MTPHGDNDISRVGVVGGGTMGVGVAEVCARAELDVRVAVSGAASAARARGRLTASLDRALRKERITERQREQILGCVEFTTDRTELADRQLVVECIVEDEPAKLSLFAELDKIVEDPEAILASNTSSLPIMRLARTTDRAGHVIGMHFFNPAPDLPLVELVGSLLTEERTMTRVRAFTADVLGKSTIVSPDRTGFVVNSLLIPYLVSAVRMLESGFASAEAIDLGMVAGCAHPLGPLRLADLIGLDIVASVADALYEEYKEPLFAPPPLLSRMVEGGLLGRKTGRGFYTYQ
ncbi:3-hydroxybutyryl-CoA dehydrogenase [Streptomyces capitiformicae]|uniref:3-hydroxybutyryl-CoA dehydrogenase n=1 Tax=Streptomyces capitiformicae TaxID=2014920 RepID=A0A919DSL7_9ACTN|nr:3-hydroxybutyryl-CoA dehydrogenase [Streptomyces capitiformicae]GHE72228.1 3-hydroxybutyryl-CoA dehydrogenase [Streptomyces capitiformicae]